MAWTTLAGRMGIGTAAQRPSSADAGDMWMATDTGALSVWDGSAWRTFSRLDSAETLSGVKTISAQPVVSAGSVKITEISAPSGAASNSILYADSTAHRLKVKDNNGSADTIAKFSDFTITQKAGSGGGNYSRTTNSYANVDGTNLTYTVTVPSGSKAIVTFCGWGNVAAGAGGGLAITDGSVIREITVSHTTNSALALQAVVAGDGASHTFVMQFKGDGTNAFTIGNSSATNAPTMVVAIVPSN